MAGPPGVVDADGFVCGATGDWAGIVAAMVKDAMAANRIGAEKRMRVRRVGRREVMVSTKYCLTSLSRMCSLWDCVFRICLSVSGC